MEDKGQEKGDIQTTVTREAEKENTGNSGTKFGDINKNRKQGTRPRP